MADGYISQIKLPNEETYDFRDRNLKVYTGSCSTAAGTAIKDVVTDGIFTLEKGAVLFVNFTNTNSAAVGNLKLKINGEADTNAKPIKYLVNGNDPANIPGAGYLRANQTYMFRYDGTNWVADLNYYTYSNDFANKIGHYNNILARKAIAAESLIVGDETGYEKVASGVTFNLAYPIVWCTGAVNANASNYANMFLQHYDRNIATGAKSGFTSTANKVIYLIVTINGNIATIDSNIITDTLPSSDDGKVYISLGKLGAQSTGANYFFLYPVHPMFWYKNGAIREYSGASQYALAAPLSGISGADDLKAIEAISETTGLLKKTAANTWTLDTSDYVTSSGITSVTIGATSPVQSSTSTAQTGSSASTTISLKDAYGDTKNPYGAKAKNLVLAGPSSGSNAAPSFRALVAADIPSLAYVPATSGANDVNTLVNTGIYNITSGSLTNGPVGYGYGQLLVMSYRKHTGNTTTDWATQLYAHLGSGNNGNTLYFRTSNASTWQTWQMVAHADAGSAKGNSTKPIYINAKGEIQEGTALEDLAYIAKPTSNATTTFLRGDGTWQTALTSHRTYTAFTGNPTGNQTPGFGSTFTIQQISQDTTGKVTGTDRTVTIPSTAASATTTGLVNTDAQTFAGVKTFDNGIHVYGTISTQGTGSVAGTMYSGGAYHSGHNSIILHGDAAGVSGIGFTSEKATKAGTTTNINGSSDRAFIQYHAYGVTAAAEGTAPTLATSGESGTLVIGVGNDATDTIRLQAPGTAGILHQIGNTAYPIPHTTNTNGSVGGTTTPVYVEAGVIKAGTALGTASQKAESYFVKAVTSTDNAIVRFNGTSGQVQNSGVTIDDSDNMAIGSNHILNQTAVPGQGEILLSVFGFKTGYPLYTDPTFLSGMNSISVYNNSGGGTVTHTRGSYTSFEVPSPGTDSSSIIKIETTGTASPGCGGFYQNIPSRANAQFVQIFRALVPADRKLYTASNTMGTGYKDEWLTSNNGTGKWEWYARRVICGQEGTMSSGGHIYIDGSIPVIWYLASCNVYDITKTEYDGLKTRYADQANAANITSTQYGIAYYSDTVGTFSGIGAGTSGQYLKSNGTSAPTWASFGTTLNSYGITNAVQYNGIDNDIGSSATAANAKAYWANNNKVPKGKIVFNYNSSGTEFTTLFSNNNNSYGSILRWGYQDTYIRILRAHPNQTTYSGWYTEDWEKISAGYADTAGNITGTLALANLTKGDVNTALMGKGSSTAPAYVSVSPSISITAGTADNAPKVNLTVLGISGTTAQELTKATTGIYGATKLSNAIDSSSEVLAATPKAVKAAYDQATSALTTANNLLATADAMVFKGTLGTGGTITAVPTGASGKEYQAGYTYKVITDGTYAGNVCEAGDLLIAIADSTSGQTAVNNAHWTVVQSNLERYIHYYNNHDNNIDSLIATPYLQTAAANGGNWNGTKPSDSHNGMALFNFQTHSGNYYTQLALDTNQNRLWLRSANNATTFGTWSKIATIADIEALDVSNISGFGTTKTLKTLTQTDGKIAATFQDIAFPVTSVAGKTGAVTLAKGDVGLGNVDNTADANKSVNYATSAGSCTGNAANVTGIVAIANGGTGATTASDARDALFPLTSFTKSITLSNTWQNLGITGADLDTNGTYIIQIYLHSTGTGSLSSYNEYYSGIMSWFKTATNSTDYDEIPLHKAGHASNGKNIYLRTQRVGTNTSPNTLQLQIKASTNTTIAAEIQIKCRLII